MADDRTPDFPAKRLPGLREPPRVGAKAPDWFDEHAYLIANPDVAESVANGEFNSAFDHYTLHGRAERRPLKGPPPEMQDHLIRTPLPPVDSAAASEVRSTIEAVLLSPGGGLLLVGWVDDVVSPLEWIRVSGAGWHMKLSASRTTRFRRADVETALGSTRMHSFGFFAFAYTAESFDAGGGCTVQLHLKDGRDASFDFQPRRVSEIELRNIVLGYVASAEVFGNRQMEAMRMVQAPLGATIVKHNRDITKQIVRGAYVEQFGPRPKRLRGSMIVCLYGKPEYLFLQSALFGGGIGFDDYEMIYVSNSPEMAEQLMKDLRTGSLIYNLRQTLILLPDNAGFGAANNLAVQHASSDRILIVNPDVFPKDEDWARKHTQAINTLPETRTRLFGVPLYYDDGSLMHGGMHFERDMGISIDQKAVSAQRMVRVEHYGKGSPAWSDKYTHSRPVPAVTGAFMSIARSWYEKLSGFTEDYVFGHYEDADLCLKSISAGIAPWIHDIRMWHLEGKGSTRLPVHEGGSYVNRALFSQRWDSIIAAGLEGINPTHELMHIPVPLNVPGRNPPGPVGLATSQAGHFGAGAADLPTKSTSSRVTPPITEPVAR